MKFILLVINLSLSVISIYSLETLGVSRVFSNYQIENQSFFLDIESILLFNSSNLKTIEAVSKELKYPLDELKSIIVDKKKNSNSLTQPDIEKIEKIEKQINNVDFLLGFEIVKFQLKDEVDFYNTEKVYKLLNFTLQIILLDCNKKVKVDEDQIEVRVKVMASSDEVYKLALLQLEEKFRLFFFEIPSFKPKIKIIKENGLLLELDKGKNFDIRSQNILVCYNENQYNIEEYSVIKVINSKEESSTAIILYKKGSFNENHFFIKKHNINLQLQFSGGILFLDKNNPIALKNNLFSFLPFANIRVVIPIGLVFFRPLFQFDFNFIYIENNFFVPFTFEVGVQGEINIHRFDIQSGVLFGALFAPQGNKDFVLNSFTIRPFIHLSLIIIQTVYIFSEFGYRFVSEGKFLEDWKTDLKGIYFNFGLVINL